MATLINYLRNDEELPGLLESLYAGAREQVVEAFQDEIVAGALDDVLEVFNNLHHIQQKPNLFLLASLRYWLQFYSIEQIRSAVVIAKMRKVELTPRALLSPRDCDMIAHLLDKPSNWVYHSQVLHRKKRLEMERLILKLDLIQEHFLT